MTKQVLQKLKFVIGLVENIVGKGENAVYQHFLLFPQCFQKAYVKSQDCVKELKHYREKEHFFSISFYAYLSITNPIFEL